MGKYSGVLLCSDFDGTLYYNEMITQENIDAIRYFQDNGGRFTVATGRFPSFIKGFSDWIRPNALLAAMNGSILYDLEEDKFISEEFLPAPFEKYMLKICREVQDLKTVRLCRQENQKIIEFYCKDIDNFLPYIDEKLLYKISFIVGSGNSDNAMSHVQSIVNEDYHVTRSYKTNLEINGVSHTKGKAVRKLATIYGAEKLVCVGDYDNDISMITAADVGYAVENATDSLKLVADKVTVSVGESAIAKIIAEL